MYIWSHIWSLFAPIQVDQKWTYVKLELVRTLLRITCLAHRKSYMIIISPFHMKSWPKVKLGQVEVGSNIAQNHSSSPYEVISGHYLPQCIWKVDQTWNLVKLEMVRTLLKITRLTYRKSNLAIIGPNSLDKWTKSEIMSSWSLFEHCSESLVLPIGSHIWSLFPHFTWKVDQKWN